MKINKKCLKSKKIFANKLTKIYKDNYNDNNNKKIKLNIMNWLEKGILSYTVDKLLHSSNYKQNFPIWWSGFYIENNKNNNPINNMKKSSKKIDGWTSLDILLSQALKEQNKFWINCKKNSDVPFNWGKYFSKSYTKISLKNNPKNIGLFVNKNIDDFLKSYFFIEEIKIINNHYKKINTKVNFYIINKKNNCKEIIDSIKIKAPYIKFYYCLNNCKKLVTCSTILYKKISLNLKKKKTIINSKKIKQKFKKYN